MLALLVRERICGLKTGIQRHKIKHRRGLSDGRSFWELSFSFFNLRDFLFLDWARAIFLFSISEPICDKLVLNRNKMVPFSKSNVCVCHSTASFMNHSLSFLFLSLLVVCLWQDFFPPNMFCICLCLCSLCILLCSYVWWGCLSFHVCVLEAPSSNLWFYLQSIKAALQLKIDGSAIERVFVETKPLSAIFSLHRALLILRLNEDSLNEMDEWSLFQVCSPLVKKSKLCSDTEDK